ncbi:MAG TPA: RHS repeat-associated core domain-containing protein [Candidatus Acidoferrum sp.]|jgi:RHS repeat-associated protein|nr:RHS repeat-associated core domain-containing protein [Candidatus Acidoferrum sp.]
MKNRNETRIWVPLTTVVFLTAMLRFVIADDSNCDNIFGCAGAAIGIGTASWQSGGYPPATSITGTTPVLTSKCECIEGDGGGHAAQLSYDTQGGGCSLVQTFIPGTLSIDAGGTGCKYTITNTGCGSYHFKIYCPQHSGTVKITAQVSGDWQICPTGYTNMCTDCSFAHPTWSVVGTVDVELPPEQERDHTPCPPSTSADCGGGGGGCSGSCSGGVQSAGTAAVENDSLNFRLYLGRASSSLVDAGFIQLYTNAALANLAVPSLLQAPFSRPGVQVLTNASGVIQQVATPQILVNVNTINSYEYHLECYYIGDVTLGGSGYYQTNGPPPFTTWEVQNPDQATHYNRLWITELRGGATRTFQYTYTAQNYRWDLLQPDQQTTLSSWWVPNGITSNYFRQISLNGQELGLVQESYQFVPALNDKVLTQRTEGDGTTTRTTTYTYYSSDPGNGGNANQLQRVDHPDGSFEYYDYDAIGRVITNYSTFENNPAPPAGSEPNPITSACKVASYAYTLSAGVDGIDDFGTNRPWVARRTIVRAPVQGALQEISRQYCHVISTNEYQTQVCPNPGAQWGDAANLYTYTKNNPDGKPYIVSRQDGTASIYYDAAGYSEVDEWRGQPDSVAYPGSIPNGTYTATIYDDLGNITSRVTTSIPEGVKLSSETYKYTDGSGNYLDRLRRSYDLADLANRTNQLRYNDCCGLSYSVDPDGATTTYIYDYNSKRLLGTSKVVAVNGQTQSVITTTNLLDGLGRVLAAMRVGTDGSVVILSKSQYDLLSRVVLETNALNGVTSHTNFYNSSSGLTITTNIYPDGGTRVEMYSRDGQLNELVGTAVAPVRYVNDVELDGSYYRVCSQEIKLNSDGSDSSEWTRTYSDGAGNVYKTVYAPRPGVDDPNNPPAQLTFYNEFGRPWKQVDPDGVATIYTYNGKGDLEYTILALTSATRGIATYDSMLSAIAAGTIQGGNDRITQVEQTVVAASGNMPDLTEVDTYLFDSGQTTGAKVSTLQTATSSLTNWSTVYRDPSTPVVTSGVTVPGTARVETMYAPDGTQTLRQYQYGRLVSTAVSNSSLGVLTSMTYGYDAQGRQNTITDARNGTTSYTLNNAGQLVAATTPAPGSGQSPQTTATTYDLSLRAVQITQPDGTVVTNRYAATGLLTNNCGSRTYPVAYTYDAQGRMKTMTTWTNYGTLSGAAVTTWNYNPYRAWLDNKRYADSTGPDYTYTAGGRLLTRSWARTNSIGQRVLTTYTYGFNDGNANDDHGNLVGVTYSNDPQNTAALVYTYDRRGRQSTITQGSATATDSFDNANDLLTENYSGGTLAGLAVTNGYDTLMRRTNLVLLSPQSAVLGSAAYVYDAASRLQTVSDPNNNSATYGYLANSALIGQITFKQGATTRMTTIKTYDLLNRLTQISSVSSVVSFGYSYNNANQRIVSRLADSSYWRFNYDPLGQVISGHKFFSDETPVAGQQFDYAFDTTGNRTQTKAGGDATGSNQRAANYLANLLNQYTNRDVPGAVDIMGISIATNTVAVNAQTAYRKGEYFRQQLNVSNGSTAVWTNITVSATGQSSQSGNQFVPKTQEQFTYDYDGNLLSDSRWNYGWDAENRLVNMTNNNASVGPQQVIRFEYDGKGRRIHKQVWGNSAGSGSPTNDVKFVYDGWNLLGELTSANVAVRAYLWGIDLSGSPQGAGGVGGLLEVVYYGSTTTNCFVAFDGNGNVSALANAGDGTVVAQYEYGPFGELVRATGPMAKANPIRFSTKYQDDETDLLDYGHRNLNTTTGRWISRDPIGEKVGPNHYCFVANSPLNRVDILGFADLVNGWPLPRPTPPTHDPDPPSTPPAHIYPPSAPWRICCHDVDGWSWVAKHCDLRQDPCDPGDKEYPVTRVKCCNKGILTDSDMGRCFKMHPTCAGYLPGDNCQSTTLDALRACCGKSTWPPSWYAFTPPDSPDWPPLVN